MEKENKKRRQSHNGPGSKLSKQSRITRMILDRIPQTPVPEPYFTIPSPEPFMFPLGETMLQGINLIEHHFPEEQNMKIRARIRGRIERLSRYKDVYCMMGKGGNGLLIGEHYMDIRGITAYCYGPKHLVVAFEDLRVDIYGLSNGIKLIKSLKEFSQKKVTFLKILSTPPNYENIVLLTYCGNDVILHRIEKSMFSGLSHKYHKRLILNLEFPVTQIIELPFVFRHYLRKDPSYRDCSLVAVSAVNSIWVLKVNHLRLNMDNFAQIDFYKRVEQVGTNSLSWGENYVHSDTRDLRGDKLVLTCSFGNAVRFFVLKEVEKYGEDANATTKCEWLESYPLLLEPSKTVAFCQFMQKNELLLITDENEVLVMGTRNNFPVYDRELLEEEVESISYKHSERLEARTVATIVLKKQTPSPPKKKASHPKPMEEHIRDVSDEIMEAGRREEQSESAMGDFALLNQRPIVTYADSFQYEQASKEIYFLTEKEFGVYIYCDWRRIADSMKLEQRYESVMVFLVAMYKRVNKFELGMGDPFRTRYTREEAQEQERRDKALSEEVQLLAIEFISSKLQRVREVPAILDNLTRDQEFFKLIVTPIEFLCETEEFAFLFEVAMDKIISSLVPFTRSQKEQQGFIRRAEEIFFTALAKFIEHGKVKFIPESQLQPVMSYYLDHDQPEMVDRLAIYFDLERVDQNTLVQCLLHNNLVVSLAHVCTQGNESLFVTPFVKFWGVSENYRRLKKAEEAAAYALRALWYMKLCLQRNWVLKEYSIEKYARMLGVLSRQFLNEKILVGLLEIRPDYCLETVAHYFTIENCQIMNHDIQDVSFPVHTPEPWIEARAGNEPTELLLSTVDLFVKKATRGRSSEYRKHMCLFLSRILIHKTVSYAPQKCFELLMDLIEFHADVRNINFGLEEKMVEEFRRQLEGLSGDLGQSDLEEILSARYIVRILTHVYYEHRQFFEARLHSLYEKSRDFQLTDLQAEIRYLQRNYAGCLDIYMHAKSAHKVLIYQFLESSFKRLTLEKRRQEKQVLAGCIRAQIKALVLLHPRKTKNLIQNYVPEIHEELIEALKDDEELQLDYLSDIVNDEHNSQTKQNLSEQSVLRYVELMAKCRPTELLEKFRENPFFPIEESLRICQKFEVYDCIEYLYERMGCITEAVKIAALRIDKVFKTRNDYSDEEIMIPYAMVKGILDNAIDICKKNHSEEIWEALLDSAIELYKKYLVSDLPQDEIEIFYFINGEIMENLASNCSIEHTISLLQTKYNNLGMGGKMTHAFINILEDLSHSINILYLSTNLIQASLRRELFKDYLEKLRCFRTDFDCETCRFPIDRREKSIHFQCGHAYHKECVVCQEPMTCMTCLVSETDQFSYYLNTLNPRFPKTKKVKELFQQHSDKRLEMSEMFKIEDYERGETRRQINIARKGNALERKKRRFEQFDETVFEIESGNRRVEEELIF